MAVKVYGPNTTATKLASIRPPLFVEDTAMHETLVCSVYMCVHAYIYTCVFIYIYIYIYI